MAPAVELGLEGLQGLIGKKVDLGYTLYGEPWLKRVTITEVFPPTDAQAVALINTKEERGILLWPDLDVSEVRPWFHGLFR